LKHSANLSAALSLLGVAAILFLCTIPTALAQKTDYPHTKCTGDKVLRTIDLTAPFHTKTRWSFEVRQEAPDCTDWEAFDPPVVLMCFIHEGKDSCSPGRNVFDSVEIVYPDEAKSQPLLEAISHLEVDGPSVGLEDNDFWTYDAVLDKFSSAFSNQIWRDSGEETRLITAGPLRGDIIVSRITVRASPRYMIEVYKPSEMLKRTVFPSSFIKFYQYESRTRSDDDNRLPVIDAEMPEIFRRLGLHAPKNIEDYIKDVPEGCKPQMRNGLLWCAAPKADSP
jgi:hypothetical protein